MNDVLSEFAAVMPAEKMLVETKCGSCRNACWFVKKTNAKAPMPSMIFTAFCEHMSREVHEWTVDCHDEPAKRARNTPEFTRVDFCEAYEPRE